MLARKITSYAIYLNTAHHELIASELDGHHAVDMSGRPIVHGRSARMPDGSVGTLIDQTPLQAVMARWCEGDFDEMEKEFAKVWRSRQAQFDLEQVIRETKYLKTGDLNSIEAACRYAHRVLFSRHGEYNDFDRIMVLAGAEPSSRAKAMRRWAQNGKPPPIRFAPYTSYVAWVEALFVFAMHAGVVTTRATNRIDIEYLKYLPFTQVFSSSDRIHEKLFSSVANKGQEFIPGPALKSALREMADYYDSLSEGDMAHGSIVYADFPPAHWTTHLRNCLTGAIRIGETGRTFPSHLATHRRMRRYWRR
jgi:hypothetical protein